MESSFTGITIVPIGGGFDGASMSSSHGGVGGRGYLIVFLLVSLFWSELIILQRRKTLFRSKEGIYEFLVRTGILGNVTEILKLIYVVPISVSSCHRICCLFFLFWIQSGDSLSLSLEVGWETSSIEENPTFRVQICSQ